MKTVDIIIPVFNEENTLEEVIQRVEQADFCGLEKKVIFVEDASTDGTREILKRYDYHTIIYHEKNMGKGAAICTGLKKSTSDVIVIQDADLEYNPEDYKKLLPSIIDGKASVVYGSRLKNKDSGFLFLSYLANTFLTKLTNILYGCNITDMETCYKAFRRDALDGIEIKSKKFEIEPEITAKICKKGIQIYEVPITYYGRTWEKGKKLLL